MKIEINNFVYVFVILFCLMMLSFTDSFGNIAYADSNNSSSGNSSVNINGIGAVSNANLKQQKNNNGGIASINKNNVSNIEERTTLDKLLISGVEVLDYKNDEKLKDPSYYKNKTVIVLNSKNRQHKIYLYTSTTSTKIPTEIVNVWLYNNDIMAIVPVTVDNTNPNWHAPSSKIIPNEFINGTWGLDIFSTKTDPKTKKKTQELLGSFNFTIELKP